MRARRANTMPRHTAPTAITAQPTHALAPKRADAAGARERCGRDEEAGADHVADHERRAGAEAEALAPGVGPCAHSGSATKRKNDSALESSGPKTLAAIFSLSHAQ